MMAFRRSGWRDDGGMSAMQRLSLVPAQEGAAAKLSLRGVTKTFVQQTGEQVTSLSNLTLDIAPGEFVCLIGPSGCGKSTLLHLLAGLDRPGAGEMLLDGRPI